MATIQDNIAYIPKINPFRLKKNMDGSFVKYAPSDGTSFQVVSKGIMLEIYVSVYTKDGALISNYTPVITTLNSIYHFYTFALVMPSVEGCYVLKMFTDHTESGKTQIEIKSEYADLALLQYNNSYNDFDCFFDGGIRFALRTEGGFYDHSYHPKRQDTVYQDQDTSFRLLKSRVYHTMTFFAGDEYGISDEQIDIINRAWACDNVFVNGQQYSVYEEASWEENAQEGHKERTWTIEVVEIGDSTVSDEFAIRIEWEYYVCDQVNGGQIQQKTAVVVGSPLPVSGAVWGEGSYTQLTTADAKITFGCCDDTVWVFRSDTMAFTKVSGLPLTGIRGVFYSETFKKVLVWTDGKGIWQIDTNTLSVSLFIDTDISIERLVESVGTLYFTATTGLWAYYTVTDTLSNLIQFQNATGNWIAYHSTYFSTQDAWQTEIYYSANGILFYLWVADDGVAHPPEIDERSSIDGVTCMFYKDSGWSNDGSKNNEIYVQHGPGNQVYDVYRNNSYSSDVALSPFNVPAAMRLAINLDGTGIFGSGGICDKTKMVYLEGATRKIKYATPVDNGYVEMINHFNAVIIENGTVKIGVVRTNNDFGGGGNILSIVDSGISALKTFGNASTSTSIVIIYDGTAFKAITTQNAGDPIIDWVNRSSAHATALSFDDGKVRSLLDGFNDGTNNFLPITVEDFQRNMPIVYPPSDNPNLERREYRQNAFVNYVTSGKQYELTGEGRINSPSCINAPSYRWYLGTNPTYIEMDGQGGVANIRVYSLQYASQSNPVPAPYTWDIDDATIIVEQDGNDLVINVPGSKEAKTAILKITQDRGDEGIVYVDVVIYKKETPDTYLMYHGDLLTYNNDQLIYNQ